MNLKTINKKCLREISTYEDKSIKLGIALGTPIVVLDIITNKKVEFSSISEAARYFNTYPKTIWRIVYGNKLYIGRYEMTAKNNTSSTNSTRENKIPRYLYDAIYIKYLSIFDAIKYNKIIIYNVILWIILGCIIYIYLSYIVWVCKEVWRDYIVAIHNINADHLKYVLEHSFILNSNQANYSYIVPENRISRFIEINKELMPNAKLGIYQSIINEIDLNFNSVTMSSAMSSIYSSPIIERIDLNDVFNTLVVKTAPISENISNNYLSINSNRNSLTLNTSIEALANKPRSTELLNYNSNILFLLINKLSPSTY